MIKNKETLNKAIDTLVRKLAVGNDPNGPWSLDRSKVAALFSSQIKAEEVDHPRRADALIDTVMFAITSFSPGGLDARVARACAAWEEAMNLELPEATAEEWVKLRKSRGETV